MAICPQIFRHRMSIRKGPLSKNVNLSPDSNVIKRWNMVTAHISYLHLIFRVLETKVTIRNRKYRNRTYVCQQSRIICATTGLTSSGISSRLFWNPTAPTTCIGFKPCQGILVVVNSHKITPKLYTSHLHANFNYHIANFKIIFPWSWHRRRINLLLIGWFISQDFWRHPLRLQAKDIFSFFYCKNCRSYNETNYGDNLYQWWIRSKNRISKSLYPSSEKLPFQHRIWMTNMYGASFVTDQNHRPVKRQTSGNNNNNNNRLFN